MVHNHLLTHWLSLWYTTVFYWPNDPLCGTHSSSICPMALPVIHYHLLQVHWLSLCEATIFSWPSCPVLWYTTFFYWPAGCLLGTLLSPTCPLAVSMVTLIFLWPTGPSYCTQLSSTGPLPPHVSVVHNYLLLAHWLSPWYITIFFLPTVYLYDTFLPSTGPLAISMVHYHLLLAH